MAFDLDAHFPPWYRVHAFGMPANAEHSWNS
jgi:hypothetical protein